MVENIICCCNGKSPSGATPIEFNVGDSFILGYQFVDQRFNPPILIPLDAFDVTFEYFIKGREETYVASKTGSLLVNCSIIPQASVIRVPFGNYNLKSGYLYGRYTFKVFDPSFPSGYKISSTEVYTGIKLIG